MSCSRKIAAELRKKISVFFPLCFWVFFFYSEETVIKSKSSCSECFGKNPSVTSSHNSPTFARRGQKMYSAMNGWQLTGNLWRQWKNISQLLCYKFTIAFRTFCPRITVCTFSCFFFSLTLNKYSFIILVLCSQSAYISHRHWPIGKYGELSLLCWHQALLFTNSSLCHTL